MVKTKPASLLGPVTFSIIDIKYVRLRTTVFSSHFCDEEENEPSATDTIWISPIKILRLVPLEKNREPAELIDDSQRSRDLILSFIWKLPRLYRVLHLLHLYFCWLAQLLLPEHLSSHTRRLIVQRGQGWFMIHTEASGRSAFRIFGLVIPSLHICRVVFDCWGQFNPVCTKSKQKLLSLFFKCFHCILISVFTVIAISTLNCDRAK